MKVKVNYNIDLNDIPDFVSDVLEKVNKKFTSNAETLIMLSERLKKGEDPLQIVSEINLFRELLSDIDSNLLDSIVILTQSQQIGSQIALSQSGFNIQSENIENKEEEKNYDNIDGSIQNE